MRPIGSQFVVQPPVVQNVAVAFVVTVSGGSPHDAVAANVAAVITNFIDGFALGAPLTWSRLAQVAYSADARVVNVTGLLLNGGVADLVPASNVVLKAGSVVVA